MLEKGGLILKQILATVNIKRAILAPLTKQREKRAVHAGDGGGLRWTDRIKIIHIVYVLMFDLILSC